MSVLFSLAQIILIDLSLAADNALIVGMAVAALPPLQRKRAMIFGLAVATALRILMACFAVQLLHITGLMLAGGILLAWVGCKMAHEFRSLHHKKPDSSLTPSKKISTAVWQIVIADLSMSLDNVLGVAGVARDHRAILAIGLLLSVALMGFAASAIGRVAAKHPKLALLGVAAILYAALSMIYDGAAQIGLWTHWFGA